MILLTMTRLLNIKSSALIGRDIPLAWCDALAARREKTKQNKINNNNNNKYTANKQTFCPSTGTDQHKPN
jgi:hypothetical protein